MIKVSEEGLARANAALQRVPGAFPRAVASAANRAADGMRTDAVRETKEKYFVKAGDVRKTITFRKATAGSMIAEMISRGKRKGLREYKLSPASPRRGQRPQLKGAVKRSGGLKPLGPAFLVRRGSGYVPFYRTGKGRWSMEGLVSPSIPQIVKNKETVKVIETKGAERFEKRLDHEVLRLLGVTR